MRRKTWKVLRWDEKPPGGPGEPLQLACNNCGNDAWMPTWGHPGSMIIAIIGMGVIFDCGDHKPPCGWQPNVIECRKCHTIWMDSP